ncbi:MAG TPA: adenylosuccinate synthase [Candidatus Peribacteraceae bacterium]|nr:adenylosuccinate synthase [Candidatus Peribacteraceae bacterium]
MQKFLQSLGPVSAVIGAQWGDEGKGKVIDILAEHFDVIARACGGANAGHTIVVAGKKHVFHLLPAGSLHEGKPVVLGAGMVIHLPTLLEEIRTLKEAGMEIVSRMYISPAAHIVFDYHKEIDAALENRRASEKGQGIGTTKRGIGPAYMDKAARSGLRMECLRWDEKTLKDELNARLKTAKEMYGIAIDLDKECNQLFAAKKLLEDRVVVNTAHLMHDFLEKKRSILIEGAQATLLDMDHGTYPYVTSSFTTAAGALQGLGLPPKALTSCIGVAKAYCTRVGSGTFVTEADEESQKRLRDRGGEYGATTGRPRRCGWLYLPDLQYAAQINGFHSWNITKLDVLDTEEKIPVGIGEKDGKVEYKYVPGWKTSTGGLQSFIELPMAAQDFISFIEDHTKIPVSLIGTGQKREDMILKY